MWGKEKRKVRAVEREVWKWLSGQMSVRRAALTSQVPAACLVCLSACIDSLLHWANSSWLTDFLSLAEEIFFFRHWGWNRCFRQLFLLSDVFHIPAKKAKDPSLRCVWVPQISLLLFSTENNYRGIYLARLHSPKPVLPVLTTCCCSKHI